ncbi:hypothetical protein OH733_03815 [Streptomyces griseus]|uniref:hypothetical protein n=1 Tax=Streptomyces griseus TaxID=1911 RepID=UPI0038659021|nr:hypothetical protein OG554_33870 [Streptomyces fimicarius]WTC85927.1 hypothetical protein OH733_03815 [Streptomyces griseus]WTD71455.1 hypothetical protein OH763_33170 [Streptomyces griseus]
MTALISRPTLRAAVLAAVAAGAVLVPSAAAFADASPKPSEPAAVTTPSPERSEAAAEAPRDAAVPSAVPRGGVAAGDRPAPAAKEAAPAVTPRGGVAAGERPAGSGDNSAAVLAGSVAGAALLAGAGTLVLRRRSAAGHNG